MISRRYASFCGELKKKMEKNEKKKKLATKEAKRGMVAVWKRWRRSMSQRGIIRFAGNISCFPTKTKSEARDE